MTKERRPESEEVKSEVSRMSPEDRKIRVEDWVVIVVGILLMGAAKVFA
jgi:hypothetical protein